MSIQTALAFRDKIKATPELQARIKEAMETGPVDFVKLATEYGFEFTAVEWSDSSMDCPEPGMSYLQVITPGYRIILQANNNSYEYHSNRDSYFVYCEGRVPPIIPQP